MNFQTIVLYSAMILAVTSFGFLLYPKLIHSKATEKLKNIAQTYPEIAQAVVEEIEKIYKSEAGQEKFRQAVSLMIKLLQDRKFTVDVELIKLFVDEAHSIMNRAQIKAGEKKPNDL